MNHKLLVLDEETHRNLKVYCALNDIKIKDYVHDLISKALNGTNKED